MRHTVLFIGHLFHYNKNIKINKTLKQEDLDMGFIAAVGIALLFPQVIRSINTTGTDETTQKR